MATAPRTADTPATGDCIQHALAPAAGRQNGRRDRRRLLLTPHRTRHPHALAGPVASRPLNGTEVSYREQRILGPGSCGTHAVADRRAERRRVSGWEARQHPMTIPLAALSES